MNVAARFFRSSLGKKYVMAGTGMGLFAFVLAHMLGNLQIFLGPAQINAYGHFLQSTPEILWPARIGLLILVGLHIWAALKVTAENRAARPIGYGDQKLVAASYASRTMMMSGLIILAFIIYHILHFTVQVQGINFTNQDFRTFEDPAKHHDVYHMMVIGFSNLWVCLFYIIGMALLFLHLSHGLSSMFQSFGWKNRKYVRCIDIFAYGAGLLLFLGYSSVPLAILTGFVR